MTSLDQIGDNATAYFSPGGSSVAAWVQVPPVGKYPLVVKARTKPTVTDPWGAVINLSQAFTFSGWTPQIDAITGNGQGNIALVYYFRETAKMTPYLVFYE